jgi:hypothetical protein
MNPDEDLSPEIINTLVMTAPTNLVENIDIDNTELEPQNSPPPIPTTMIQPAPAKLVIHKPSPTLTIQTNTQETKELQTQPVSVHPTIKPAATLNAMLIKSDSESLDFFELRSAYSRAAEISFGGKVNPSTSILIGRMAANKTMYGVTYPEESDRVLRYINNQLSSQPEAFSGRI